MVKIEHVLKKQQYNVTAILNFTHICKPVRKHSVQCSSLHPPALCPFVSELCPGSTFDPHPDPDPDGDQKLINSSLGQSKTTRQQSSKDVPKCFELCCLDTNSNRQNDDPHLYWWRT